MRKTPPNVDNKMNKDYCNLLTDIPNNIEKKFKFLDKIL